MPATYDKMGIRFLYPDNWILDEQEAVEGNRSLTVYSPGGAFWSITLHPASADVRELASTAMAALKAEYEGAEAEPVTEEIGGQELTGYDLHFFFLDLINTALVRGFPMAGASCLVLCQAEDREFEQFRAVFRAMTTSLLAESTGP